MCNFLGPNCADNPNYATSKNHKQKTISIQKLCKFFMTPFCMIFFFLTKVACFDVFYDADKGSEIFLRKIRCISQYLPNFRLYHKWYLTQFRIKKKKKKTFIESYKTYKNCLWFIRKMHYNQG